MKITAVALGVALILSGCSASGQPSDGVSVQQPAPAPAPTEPEDSAEPESEAAGILRSCRDSEQVGSQNTVTGQTNALRDGDFEAAYSYASPSFQETVSLEQFTGLILASYQPLLAEAVIEFGECLARDDGGQVSLDVVLRAEEGANSLGIRYVLVDTDEGWRVSGASDFRLAGQST